uniref:CBS domain-containing protein n=1 Tax=Chromera velia CCMP2878 TaxID=1169474 RepID=A0A0G4IDA0_9ALVE|eukprot:Cvel_111.t1-p1 / transcript=Cvel_111.t1 / gene=Cvel_111 / organism=Chromera_velia_CCMP2878 / gene_product=hypothetical protein / transcript_product=hypothetical protein / location=Cvel_scaffold8:161374-173362(+) / protein_length=654 / sequence_SO=supercontig / SO=protein_coding / is_pseudo=false
MSPSSPRPLKHIHVFPLPPVLPCDVQVAPASSCEYEGVEEQTKGQRGVRLAVAEDVEAEKESQKAWGRAGARKIRTGTGRFSPGQAKAIRSATADISERGEQEDDFEAEQSLAGGALGGGGDSPGSQRRTIKEAGTLAELWGKPIAEVFRDFMGHSTYLYPRRANLSTVLHILMKPQNFECVFVSDSADVDLQAPTEGVVDLDENQLQEKLAGVARSLETCTNLELQLSRQMDLFRTLPPPMSPEEAAQRTHASRQVGDQLRSTQRSLLELQIVHQQVSNQDLNCFLLDCINEGNQDGRTTLKAKDVAHIANGTPLSILANRSRLNAYKGMNYDAPVSLAVQALEPCPYVPIFKEGKLMGFLSVSDILKRIEAANMRNSVTKALGDSWTVTGNIRPLFVVEENDSLLKAMWVLRDCCECLIPVVDTESRRAIIGVFHARFLAILLRHTDRFSEDVLNEPVIEFIHTVNSEFPDLAIMVAATSAELGLEGLICMGDIGRMFAQNLTRGNIVRAEGPRIMVSEPDYLADLGGPSHDQALQPQLETQARQQHQQDVSPPGGLHPPGGKKRRPSLAQQKEMEERLQQLNALKEQQQMLMQQQQQQPGGFVRQPHPTQENHPGPTSSAPYGAMASDKQQQITSLMMQLAQLKAAQAAQQ